MKPKRSFWTKLVDCGRRARLPLPGESVQHHDRFARADHRERSRRRRRAHLRLPQQKYKFLTRHDKSKDETLTPQCVAVDAQDNIYVTDSQAGKIFVFDANGKYQRAIGSLKGGEGFFKRPTGIAVDSAAQQIYVTDTLRNKIYVMDMQGSVLQTIGKPGTGDGEFNYPTELRLNGNDLVVVDAMNFRVQVLDRSGDFRYSIGKLGDGTGWMFRPKGIGFDSEGHLYVVDGAWGVVQVFNQEGQLLYYFGQKAPGRESFSCRLDCRSTATTASTWWIRTTTACRYFIITDCASRLKGEAVKSIRSLASLVLLAAIWRLQQTVPDDTLGMHNLTPGSGASIYFTSGSIGCTFCHAPHSGLGGITPLWNQKLSKATIHAVHQHHLSPDRQHAAAAGRHQQSLSELP